MYSVLFFALARMYSTTQRMAPYSNIPQYEICFSNLKMMKPHQHEQNDRDIG